MKLRKQLVLYVELIFLHFLNHHLDQANRQLFYQDFLLAQLRYLLLQLLFFDLYFLLTLKPVMLFFLLLSQLLLALEVALLFQGMLVKPSETLLVLLQLFFRMLSFKGFGEFFLLNPLSGLISGRFSERLL